MLKSEKTDLALLGAHYGFSGAERVLRALQRDSLQAQRDHLQDVYENPIAKVLTANSKRADTIWSRKSNLMRWMHYCLTKEHLFLLHHCTNLLFGTTGVNMYWIYSSAMVMHLTGQALFCLVFYSSKTHLLWWLFLKEIKYFDALRLKISTHTTAEQMLKYTFWNLTLEETNVCFSFKLQYTVSFSLKDIIVPANQINMTMKRAMPQ